MSDESLYQFLANPTQVHRLPESRPELQFRHEAYSAEDELAIAMHALNSWLIVPAISQCVVDDQPAVVAGFGEFLGVARHDREDDMKIAVADMSKQRSRQRAGLQIGFDSTDALGELADGNTDIGQIIAVVIKIGVLVEADVLWLLVNIEALARGRAGA